MPWFKLDDAFDMHPKVVSVGNSAVGLFCRAGVYCARHLTDGFIPSAVATMYGSRRDINQLVASTLWVEVEGGYAMPDFLEYQPSRADVEDRRSKRARAGSIGGKASASSRANGQANAPPHADPDASTMAEPPSRPVPSLLENISAQLKQRAVELAKRAGEIHGKKLMDNGKGNNLIALARTMTNDLLNEKMPDLIELARRDDLQLDQLAHCILNGRQPPEITIRQDPEPDEPRSDPRAVREILAREITRPGYLRAVEESA